MADEPDPLARYGQGSNAYEEQFGRRIDAAVGKPVRRSPPRPSGGGGNGAGGWGAGAIIFLIVIILRIALAANRDSRRNHDYQPRFDHTNFQRVDDDWNRPRIPPVPHFREGNDAADPGEGGLRVRP